MALPLNHSKTYMALVVQGLALAGCASAPSDIKASYVSPIQFQAYSCAQLEQERDRLGHEVATVSDQQTKARTGDVIYTTVGAIIFWPALIGLAFTKDQGADLARLKGEYDAIEGSQRMKGCLLPVVEASAP